MMSAAAIDAKFTKIQAMSLQKKEIVTEFLNRLVQLASELEAAGYSVSGVEKTQSLPSGSPKKHKATIEAILLVPHAYTQAVVKNMVRESRFKKTRKCK